MSTHKQDMESIIEIMESAGYEVRRNYSGRGMFGATCVAVELDKSEDLWNISKLLTDFDLKAPKTDSMGRGMIAYWPTLTTETAEEDSEEEEAVS
jgi:hypothetical protein